MRVILLILFIALPAITARSQSLAEQVKTIQDDARVRAAFDYIDQNHDGILREWIAITEINAPTAIPRASGKSTEARIIPISIRA